MFRLLLIVASFGAIIAVPRRTTTVKPSQLGISGSDPTEIEKYPYEVSIEHNKNTYCSGTIVSPKYVLTSAVCAQKQDNGGIIRSRSTYRKQYGKEHEIESVIVHEDYNESDNENNIALLKVKDSFDQDQIVQWDSRTRKIKEGTEGVVVGWGKNNKNERNRHLYEMRVVVSDEDNCVPSERDQIYLNEFCAKPIGNASSLCYGDEGAPLVVKGLNPQADTLLGFVSIRSKQGCMEDGADLYIDVRSFSKWIGDAIAGKITTPVPDPTTSTTTRPTTSTTTKPTTSTTASPPTSTTKVPPKPSLCREQSKKSEKHPYEVSLERNKHVLCFGTIVSPHHVLTSAKCASKRDAHTVIRSGSTYGKEKNKAHPIVSVQIHEDYNEEDNEHNIALLKTSERFDENRVVIMAPHRQHIDVGTMGVVSGWHKDSGHSINRNYFEVDVTILDEDDCSIPERDQVYDTEFCAKPTSDKDGFCYADEGAPLVVCGYEPQRDTLLGFMSVRSKEQCKGYEGDLYIDVGSYRPWIDEGLADDKPQPW